MNEGYTKVFVSLDGTEQQDFVLARAIKVAANNGAKLIIGHVIDSTALESAGSYPVDLVNGLEEAFKNSIAKQLEEAKANPDIPEVEVMIRAGRIRETLKDEMLDVVKPDLVLCGARGLSSIKYALLGSISTFLLRNTDCDILVVEVALLPPAAGPAGFPQARPRRFAAAGCALRKPLPASRPSQPYFSELSDGKNGVPPRLGRHVLFGMARFYYKAILLRRACTSGMIFSNITSASGKPSSLRPRAASLSASGTSLQVSAIIPATIPPGKPAPIIWLITDSRVTSSILRLPPNETPISRTRLG